jgi:hypothetical protein
VKTNQRLGRAPSSVVALRSEPLLASPVNPHQASAVTPLRAQPIEIDIADPAMAAYRRDASVEAFAQLEERFPADPDQLSGASVRVGDSGRHTTLWVGFGTHCLGVVFVDDVARLAACDLADAELKFATPLFESYPQFQPYRTSGAYLSLSGGESPELSLGFGGHCCGVLRGQNLRTFLECVRVRLGERALMAVSKAG